MSAEPPLKNDPVWDEWLIYPLYILHYVGDLKTYQEAALNSVKRWPLMYEKEKLANVRDAVRQTLSGRRVDLVKRYELGKHRTNEEVYQYLQDVLQILEAFTHS